MPSRVAKTGAGGRPLGAKAGGEAGAHGKTSTSQLDEEQMQVTFIATLQSSKPVSSRTTHPHAMMSILLLYPWVCGQ